jgi:hypothetical protein
LPRSASLHAGQNWGVSLYIITFAPKQTGHFAGMWREDEFVSVRFVHAGMTDSFQRSRVEDEAPLICRARNYSLYQSVDGVLIH